jgi:hypothetical protein
MVRGNLNQNYVCLHVATRVPTGVSRVYYFAICEPARYDLCVEMSPHATVMCNMSRLLGYMAGHELNPIPNRGVRTQTSRGQTLSLDA